MSDYPPPPPPPPPPSHHTTLLHVRTQSDGVIDQRIEVAASSSPSSSALWHRERTLHSTEIVDSLVESSSGKTAWTIHRPSRGWYLHLRSPSLPPGTAIALHPQQTDDPSISPLTFCLQTRVDREALAQTTSLIDGDKEQTQELTRVSMEGHSRSASVPTHALASATEVGAKGHARRRSAATSVSLRKPSSKFDRSIPSIAEGQAAALRHAQVCTLVLCDGARQPAAGSKQGWARWVHGMFPQDLRPVLALETRKSFSLWWTDPPQRRPIEVMRFEDTSGWWLWDAGSRGTLTLQTKAVQALGLQRAFWVAMALAYLDHLEAKDGYRAASQG